MTGDEPAHTAGETGAPPPASATAEITLELPAELKWIGLARAVVFDIGMRADFGVGSLDDLKIAVDEACSQLINVAGADATIQCRFVLDEEQLRVVLTTTAPVATTVSRNSFGWHVLTVVADEVWARDATHTVADTDPASLDGHHPVSIGVAKSRTGPRTG